MPCAGERDTSGESPARTSAGAGCTTSAGLKEGNKELLLNPRIEVRNSPIHGKSLYAKEPFKKGETFSAITDVQAGDFTVMSDEEFRAYTETVDSWNAVYLGNGLHKVGTLVPEDDPSNFGNHSCEPNAAPIEDGLVALRDIEVGQELTIDYAQVSPASWQMRCSCGARHCRKIVRGHIRT